MKSCIVWLFIYYKPHPKYHSHLSIQRKVQTHRFNKSLTNQYCGLQGQYKRTVHNAQLWKPWINYSKRSYTDKIKLFSRYSIIWHSRVNSLQTTTDRIKLVLMIFSNFVFQYGSSVLKRLLHLDDNFFHLLINLRFRCLVTGIVRILCDDNSNKKGKAQFF